MRVVKPWLKLVLPLDLDLSCARYVDDLSGSLDQTLENLT